MKKIILFMMLFAVAISPGAARFDADKAFLYLEKQVDFGPRFPGSPGNRDCRNWLLEFSSRYADTTFLQTFEAYRPVTDDTVTAGNIIVRFHPEIENRVMLSTHWDTRPFADRDPLFPNRPVPGANDGASGTAVLCELLASIEKMDLALDVIFWDAEDMGLSGGRYYCQGSEYYAENPVSPVPEKGILIDMIGDSDLQLPIEVNSLKYAPVLQLRVWGLADRLGYGHVFQKKMGPDMFDDHIPLNKIGIKTINIIDFDYTCRGRNVWHTTRDIPECCSPESLRIIGEVLLEWLSQLPSY